MPALSSYVEVLTVSGYDTNRKDDIRDFYDREVMVYALAYPNVFVTIDKWIKDLLDSQLDTAIRARVEFFTELAELNQYLERMAKI